MNIGFAGTPESAKIVLNGLIENNIIPKIIITKPDKKLRKKFIESPVSVVGRENNIKTIKPVHSSEIVPFIKDVDLMIVVAFGMILPKELVKIPKYGWLNIHYSKLPDLRGAAPVQRAILRGDTKFYGSIFRIEEKMDSGPVFADFSITDSFDLHSADEIIKKLSEESISHLLEVIKNIDTLTPVEQKGNVTFAQKIEKKELEVKYDNFQRVNYNKIRIGDAYFFHNEKRVEIISAQKENEIFDEPIKFMKNAVYISYGGIELLTVKPEGKNVMPAADWARGVK